jgi:hypothetical protein
VFNKGLIRVYIKFPRHRLFILGAGFSKPAGFPLGPELLEDVRIRVRNVFRRSGWDGALEEEIDEWRQLYPGKPLNLESVLAYSHRKHFLGVIGSEEYFNHGSRSIVEVRQAIQTILTERLPKRAPLLYREFANQLTPYDVVLTFNYDTLLEQSLEEINKPFSLTPEWWLDTESGVAESYSWPQFVDIIKLHGSIDWYDKSDYDQKREYFSGQRLEVPDSDPLFGPNKSVPTESLARGRVKEGQGTELLTRVFRVPDHSSHYPFAQSWEVVPFLLPPAYDKLLGSDPIRDLWQNMHLTQDSYSAIVVIGYSMPSYDGYAYEALGHLLINYQAGGPKTSWKQRRVPVQIITYASSEAEIYEAIPFLKPDKTKIWTAGFSTECLKWIDWGDSTYTA